LYNKQKILGFALIAGIFIMLGKFIGWYITGSNAILSDGLESMVNVAAGAFALYSVIVSARPKDFDHPYGHGKVEFISAGLEGFMIGIAGIVILIKSIYNLIKPQEISSIDTGIFIVAIAGLFNFILALFLRKFNKKKHSVAVDANARHLMTDAATSAALVIGLIIIHFTSLFWLDNVIAIAFGSMIFLTGYKLVRKSVAGVMDEADYILISEIIEVLSRNRKDNWIDIHNFRIIKYGNDLHIDCHITLPWYYDLRQSHEELKQIENHILALSENYIEIFIHADPCVPASCRICNLIICPVRQHMFERGVEWKLSNVLKNEKHNILTH
jgi:cation diffusion facilitator family transporter